MSQAEMHALFFVRTWAEAVLRQVERVRTIREKDAIDTKDYERMEDCSPTDEDIGRNFRSWWAEEHTLIWAAHHLERWSRRLATERGQEPPQPDRLLARVRNALEHLDEADFDEIYALPGDGAGNRSLRALPNGRVAIALGGRLAFDVVDPGDLERRALSVVSAIEDELEQAAVDWYFEIMRDS